MHDDTCNAYAKGRHSGLSVHCWLPPNHPGDHLDRDLNIYWRTAPDLSVMVRPRRPLRMFGRRLVVA
jgi:hypothetical protein